MCYNKRMKTKTMFHRDVTVHGAVGDTITVEILRWARGKRVKKTYVLPHSSYGNRNLPRILDKADHVEYTSPKSKGQGLPWVDGEYKEDIPCKFEYFFRACED